MENIININCLKKKEKTYKTQAPIFLVLALTDIKSDFHKYNQSKHNIGKKEYK